MNINDKTNSTQTAMPMACFFFNNSIIGRIQIYRRNSDIFKNMHIFPSTTTFPISLGPLYNFELTY